MLVTNPHKTWDAISVAQELRSNSTLAKNQLAELKAKGLISITSDNKYRYSPSDDIIFLTLKELTLVYAEKPVAVISCIYERPADKLKSFADAFKLKKD